MISDDLRQDILMILGALPVFLYTLPEDVLNAFTETKINKRTNLDLTNRNPSLTALSSQDITGIFFWLRVVKTITPYEPGQHAIITSLDLSGTMLCEDAFTDIAIELGKDNSLEEICLPAPNGITDQECKALLDSLEKNCTLKKITFSPSSNIENKYIEKINFAIQVDSDDQAAEINKPSLRLVGGATTPSGNSSVDDAEEVVFSKSSPRPH